MGSCKSFLEDKHEHEDDEEEEVETESEPVVCQYHKRKKFVEQIHTLLTAKQWLSTAPQPVRLNTARLNIITS